MAVASPTITSVRFNTGQYNGKATTQVVVFWRPAPGSGKNFVLKLYQDGTEIASGKAFGISGNLNTSAITFVSTSLYEVRVMEDLGGSFGPPSDTVEVIWTAPPGLTIAYNGTTISAEWQSPPGRASTTGGVITLYKGSDIVESHDATGITGSFAPVDPLVSTDTYSVVVAATYGPSIGPTCAPVNVIQSRPTISQLQYNSGTIQVSALPLVVPAMGASLYREGALVQTFLGTGALLVFKPSAALQPWATYTVQLWAAQTDQNQQATVISSGPPSEAVPVVTAVPAIQAVDFTDGETIALSWRNGPGVEMLTGGLIMLLEAGTIKQAADADGTSGTITPDPRLSPTDKRTLQVASTRWMSTGPSSAGVNLLTARPSVAQLCYEGGVLSVGWDAVGGEAASYLVGVFDGSTLLATQPATGTSAAIPILLDESVSYSVAVKAVTGDVAGPFGTARAAISAAPTITNVTTGDGLADVTFAPPALTAGIDGYQVQLFEDGLPKDKPVTATNMSARISYDFMPGYRYSVLARAVGTDPEKFWGPWSGLAGAGAPVLTVPVVDLKASLVGNTFIQARWDPVTGQGVDGYQVTVDVNGTTPFTETTTETTRVSNNWYEKMIDLKDGQTISLKVAAASGSSLGPIGQNDVTLITARPTMDGATYNGSILLVKWTQVTIPGVDQSEISYVLMLGAGDAAMGEWETGLTFKAVPVTLDPNIYYNAYVKAVRQTKGGPTLTGRYSDAQPIIGAVPSITAASMGGKNADGYAELNVTVKPATTIAYGIFGYEVQLFEEDAPVGDPVETDQTQKATISYQFKDGYRYSVLARGTGIDNTKSWGKWSGQAGAGPPVVTVVPGGLTASYDKQLVKVSWDPVIDARVDGYEVTLTVTDTPAVTQRVEEAYCQFELSPPAGAATASITVAAVAGGSTGSTGTSLNIVLHEPTINAAAYDGSTLNLGWSAVADAGVNGYIVSLFSNGAITQQARFGGTSGVLSVPPGPFAARVQAVSDRAMGPMSGSVTLLNTAPRITSKGFDAATGNFSMTWDGVPNAGGYSIEVMGTSLGEKTSGTSFSLTSDKFPPAGVYYVRVRAIASSTDDSIAGPWSLPVTLLLIRPDAVAVEYDGRQAKISWEPVASPLAIGYRITVLGGASQITAWTATNSAVVAVPFDASKQFNLVVQAVTDDVTGQVTGQPTTQNQLFQPGFYLSTDQSKAPYLFPATTPEMADQDIVVYLPELFTTPVSSEDLPATPPFVFAVTTQKPFAYTLTMPADSIVWTFAADPGIRSDVKAAYDKLLSELTKCHITPLGWRVVQDAIAIAMPQTFFESLYYGYGFAPDDGYIDLKPGMVLRVEYEGYQYTGPNQSDSRYLNGFIGTNTAEYELGSYIDSNGNWLTGLDAFLSLVTQNGTRVLPPLTSQEKTAGGGGVIDFYFGQFRLPFLRLVYPPNLISPSTPGTPYPAYNVAVLAASDYVALDTATRNLRRSEPLVSGTVAAYLRGRAMVSACTRVWLNGEARVVPVGTTAGNVLESMASRPPALDQYALAGLRLTRATGYAVTKPTADGYPVGGGYPIRLDWAGASTHAATPDWLTLPLFLGDRLDADERRVR